MYTLLTHNSKYYGKFLIAYVILMLILFSILGFCQIFSTFTIILSIVYIISLWIFTVWITVSSLRKLFIKNQLLDWKIFDGGKTVSTHSDIKGKSTNSLSEDIVKQFIKTWYDEISQDEEFSVESRILIESTLNLLRGALDSINKKHFTYTVGNIYLKHIKEFRRTLKVKEKNGENISDLYRYFIY